MFKHFKHGQTLIREEQFEFCGGEGSWKIHWSMQLQEFVQANKQDIFPAVRMFWKRN